MKTQFIRGYCAALTNPTMMGMEFELR